MANKIFSDNLSDSLLATAFRGDITYVIPYLIEVDTVLDNEDYTIYVNNTAFTYTSSANATESEILKGLKSQVSVVSLTGTESGPFNLNGLVFDLEINGISISLSGLTDNLSAVDFQTALTTEAEGLGLVSGDLESENVDFEIQVTGSNEILIKTSRSLLIQEGTANPVLGFTDNDSEETPQPVLSTIFTDKETTDPFAEPPDPTVSEVERLKILQDPTQAPFVIPEVSTNLKPVKQNVYIALFNSITVNDEIVPAEISEDGVPDKGYHRVKGEWDAPSNRRILLGSDSVFGPAIDDDWGEITHYAVYDQLEGGRLLASGPITVAKFIMEGDYYIFRDGDLGLGLD